MQNQYVYDNRPIHVIIRSEKMWRVLALVSSAAFVVVALWTAIERVCQ